MNPRPAARLSSELVGRSPIRLAMLLGALTAFGPLSMDMYLPAFPELADNLHTTPGAVQLTLSADVLGLVIGQLMLGPLSDAHGRRRLLIASTAGCAVASLLCALATTIGQLLVWRFVQGACGGGGIVLARAIAADVAAGPAAARLFAGLTTVANLAPVLAPVAGTVLLAWTGSWRASFAALAGFSAVLAVITYRIPESLVPDRRRGVGWRAIVGRFRILGRDRGFAAYTLVVGAAYAALFAYLAASPFVLQTVFGLSPSVYGGVFALNAAGLVGLSVVNMYLLRRHAARRLLRAALVVSAAAAVLLLVLALAWASIGPILVALFVIVAFRSWISANATHLAVERAADRGTASAVVGACMFGAGLAVTPIISSAGSGSSVPMAAVICAGSVLALVAAPRAAAERRENRIQGTDLC